MVYLQQHLLLGVQVHQLVLLQDFLLSHYLQCIDLLLASEFDQLHPAEGAIAQRGEYFQVVAF